MLTSVNLGNRVWATHLWRTTHNKWLDSTCCRDMMTSRQAAGKAKKLALPSRVLRYCGTAYRQDIDMVV